jgi:hypothetical protein
MNWSGHGLIYNNIPQSVWNHIIQRVRTEMWTGHLLSRKQQKCYAHCNETVLSWTYLTAGGKVECSSATHKTYGMCVSLVLKATTSSYQLEDRLAFHWRYAFVVTRVSITLCLAVIQLSPSNIPSQNTAVSYCVSSALDVRHIIDMEFIWPLGCAFKTQSENLIVPVAS